MEILKSKEYEKDYKKKIEKLHKKDEAQIIKEIEALIIKSNNLKELMENSLRITYNIRHKYSNLKEYYTADINRKLRLFLRPIGEYPYCLIEIEKIEFTRIDDKHYGDG